MATHKSAEKRARQAEKRRVRNRALVSALRTREKAVREAIASGDRAAAEQRLREAERALRRAATKGVVKRTTVSRHVSRLTKSVNRVGRAGS